MRYGDGNISFFGKLRSPDTAFILVFRRVKDNCLCLEAGLALGVYKDDEYAIYPPYVSGDIFNDTTQAAAKVRVDAVWSLTSGLIGIDPTSVTHHVKTG